MALNFKNDEVDRLARELAAATGESLTEAVRKSLEERLQREKVKRTDRGKLKEELRAIRRRVAALPDLDDRTPEEILGYDEFGLPR